jgi:hypothetical protein
MVFSWNIRSHARRLALRVGVRRGIALGLVVLIIVGIAIPVLNDLVERQRYVLDAKTVHLVGTTHKNLAAKFAYDSQKSAWQFNQKGIARATSKASNNPIDALKAQVGGEGAKDESLYSVNLPTDGAEGTTYYDYNTNLSFTLIPQFEVAKGKEKNGQLIYPIQDGAKLIYTAKNNGMKEDIVLSHNIGNDLQFTYKLNLPKTLETKIQDDGSIGIFSADPALFGDISYGADTDREKVESARLHAVKDHLVFALPAPVIKHSGSDPVQAAAQFVLSGDTLRVVAHNMDKLDYPATVDPSVVVTSTGDFATGDNSGNIDYPSGQVNRGALTGGSLAAWGSTSTGSYTARFAGGNVAYNGYIYLIGGNGVTNSDYAPINSNGTIGAWASTTALPSLRLYAGAAAYNGYMYIFGGVDNGTSAFSSVLYAPINSSTGALGSWTTSSNAMATAACKIGWAQYNGYLYATGGNTGTVGSGGCANSSATQSNAVQYAPILANGDVGAWSTSSNTFTNVRQAPGSVAYNGFLYVVGGTLNGATIYRDVQYAPILANGDIGTWVTSASQIPGTNYRFGIDAYNGYIYQSGGAGTSQSTATSFAPIKANGDVGSWVTTAAMATGRYAQGFAAYNGYIYNYAGFNPTGAVALNDTFYSKIDSAGVPGSYTTSANTFTSTRRGMKSIAYNGYLYVMGGDAGAGPVATVYKSTLASDGTLGAFTSTTSMPASLTYFAATAYQGYMYVLGGCTSAYASCTTGTNNVATVYSSPINASNGTLGTWVTQTSFTTSRYGLATATYNGYIYVLGGVNASTFQNDIQYHAIAASGTISGAWSTSAQTISTARAYFGATTHGGRLYLAGGCSAGAITCTSVLSDIQYASLDSSGDLSAALTSNGTSFTNARGSMELVISGGFAYIVGGRDNTTYYADTQYAPVNSNGSIGTWATGASIATARYGLGTSVYNGFIYATGGYNGTTYYNNAQYARLNNGGGGAVGSWTSTTSFTTARSAHSTVAYKNNLYVIGGYNGTAQSDVQYATLGTDGTVGSWTSTTGLPAARRAMGSFAYNGYLYVLGGLVGASAASTVYYAPIDSSTGAVGSWTSTTAFSTARDTFQAVAYNGYAYIAGGEDAVGTLLSDVQYAPINSDGTLGSWTSTNSFTTARLAHAVLAYAGYLYILGGTDNTNYLNDVQYALLNSNGTVGTWAQTTAFNTGRLRHSIAAYNGNIYVIGGSTAAGKTNDVQSAQVNSNGTLGSWQQTTAFTTAKDSLGSVAANGYLYVVGGNDTGYSAVVQYAPLDVISRAGLYSTIVDFGAEYNLSGITFNGNVPGGITSISYKVASSTGILGSWQQASGITASSACTTAATRYVLVAILLDDSQSAVFPDSAAGSYANATDVTLNYAPKHPDPNVRLRQGKYFSSEVLQPLDTCQ